MRANKNKDIWRPWVEMKSLIPFRVSGKSGLYREIEIERGYSLSNKYGRTDQAGKNVSIKVIWYEGDRRDKEILSGQERQQNSIIDIVNLLMVLKEMFPEYSITFVDPNESEAIDA